MDGNRTVAETAENTFLYFGYGSNLLKERLQLKNPSAEFVEVGELKGFRLCFGQDEDGIPSRWQGCVASIERSHPDTVWGVVWRLNTEDLPHLDEQEDTYRRFEVTVTSRSGASYVCWSYCMISFVEGPPSPQYLDVIRRGARQNNLPEKYRQWLESIVDNGYKGTVKIMDLINNRLDEEDNTFLYFSYGSNLLKARIHQNNPTAKLVGPAKLQGYRLCFRPYPDWTVGWSIWRGPPATIDKSPDEHVWGAVWRIHNSNMEHLDSQECVYRAIEVTVTSQEGVDHVCRTYELIDPLDQQPPSPHYLKVIVAGAIESAVPESYVDILKSIPHNGDQYPPPIMAKLFPS